MPRKFTESIALQTAKAQVEARAFPWERTETIFVQKPWWGIFGANAYLFEFIGEFGWADVWVKCSDTVPNCTIYPVDGRFMMAPPWIQFPEFTSVTIFWRMAPGEEFWCHWHWWFRRLSIEERLNYRKLNPAPTDEQRGWSDFYSRFGDLSNERDSDSCAR